MDRPKLDFAQFKRRKRGNLQVGGTGRPGVPAYRGWLLDFAQNPGLAADSEKTPPTPATGGVGTRAMASTKVGDGLSYQAALRRVMGWRFCNA